MYANITTQTITTALPRRLGATHIADPYAPGNWPLYHAQGWRVYDGPGPQPPAGYQVSGQPEVAQDPARPDHCLIEWPYDAALDLPPEPSPVVIEIDETGAVTGRTFRLLVCDGALVTTVNSASPQKPGKEQVAAAIAKRRALEKVGSSAAAANSIPALREQVRMLVGLLLGDTK